MTTRIQWLHGTAAEATAQNPILAVGEPGFERDTGLFKVGDGATAWNSLPYATSRIPASVIQAYRLDQFTAPSFDVAFNNKKITGLANPTSDQDAVTKAFVALTSQPLDPDLTAIAALTSAADQMPYSTGAGAWAMAGLTAAGRLLNAAANAAAQRAALSLGTAALVDTGITTGNVPTVAQADARYRALVPTFVTLANGTTAMALGTNDGVQVTPTVSATLTSTVPAAGRICTIKILTSGTSTFTLTFGTGFKSTGTLATGTTSGKVFIITFVSDGTTLNEMSRTVAM